MGMLSGATRNVLTDLRRDETFGRRTQTIQGTEQSPAVDPTMKLNYDYGHSGKTLMSKFGSLDLDDPETADILNELKKDKSFI